jgi:Trp operon repressor
MVMRRALTTSDRNTAGTRLRIYAIFLRNRNAQKLKSKIDMMIWYS